jgi:hypothetical protein
VKSSRTLKKATEVVVRSGACFVSMVLGCASLPAQATPQEAPQLTALSKAVTGFAPFDLDGDGRPEILSLSPLSEPAGTGPLVVVLVEQRLTQGDKTTLSDGSKRLAGSLDRFASDVAHEGHTVMMMAVELHAGEPHQDGRTLLALRRLLQRLYAVQPMSAAVLVGHFPDALLVRTCNWRRQEKLELPGKDGEPVAIAETTTNVRCVPEYVAHRCDLVLADLDGNWEELYVPGPAKLPSVTAVFGDTVPDAGGPCVAMSTREMRVVDVFHVRDGKASVDRDAFAVALDAEDRDHECTAADRTAGNALAMPEIAVSRIDARGVSVHPELRALAFDKGEPRAVGFELAGNDRSTDVQWAADGGEEQRLLCEYFDRNHAFRTQPLPAERRRPASIAQELGSGMNELRAADAAWRDFKVEGYDVDGADLIALLQWLQRPAVLRTLRAHSDGYFAQFAKTDAAALERNLGKPWRWTRYGQRLEPSWAANQSGRADFVFFRALYDAHVLPDDPYLLIHTGCEVLSPPNAVQSAYDDPAYGRFAQAEAMLFFTPCLALVGRAKVFYDEPRGFCEALGKGATFGEAWRRYFAVEAAAKSWGEVGGDIGRKRAYFWSMIGDCTLRLPK